MMYTYKIVAIFLVLNACLIGCQTIPQKQSVEEGLITQNIDKIVVAFYMPDKSIRYMEEGFMKEEWKKSSFDGVWDVDRHMTDYSSRFFIQSGAKATSIFEVLDAKGLASYFGSRSQYISDNEIPLKTRREILALGHKYILEISSSVLTAMNPVGFRPTLSGNLLFKITNLQRNEVVYHSKTMQSYRTPKSKEQMKKNIESKNLKIVKDFMRMEVDSIPILHYLEPLPPAKVFTTLN